MCQFCLRQTWNFLDYFTCSNRSLRHVPCSYNNPAESFYLMSENLSHQVQKTFQLNFSKLSLLPESSHRKVEFSLENTSQTFTTHQQEDDIFFKSLQKFFLAEIVRLNTWNSLLGTPAEQPRIDFDHSPKKVFLFSHFLCTV